MTEKRVYTFGNGKAEGNAQMREVLGGKGANLAEMNLIGVPVPPGFTIITDCCNEYYKIGQEKIIKVLEREVNDAVKHIENLMNSKFGDTTNPLLVSVRSGARASMPGMMDTILNLVSMTKLLRAWWLRLTILISFTIHIVVLCRCMVMWFWK